LFEKPISFDQCNVNFTNDKSVMIRFKGINIPGLTDLKKSIPFYTKLKSFIKCNPTDIEKL